MKHGKNEEKGEKKKIPVWTFGGAKSIFTVYPKRTLYRLCYLGWSPCFDLLCFEESILKKVPCCPFFQIQEVVILTAAPNAQGQQLRRPSLRPWKPPTPKAPSRVGTCGKSSAVTPVWTCALCRSGFKTAEQRKNDWRRTLDDTGRCGTEPFDQWTKKGYSVIWVRQLWTIIAAITTCPIPIWNTPMNFLLMVGLECLKSFRNRVDDV